MKKSRLNFYVAPILLTLAACSAGNKSASTPPTTPSPDLAQERRAPALTPEATPKIGVIRNPKFVGECGFSLQLAEDYKSRNEKYIFDADLEESGQMNIDGRDVDLKMIDNGEPNRELKVGERFSKTYASGNLNARVDYVVDKVCDPKDESCEAVYFSATITVERNGARQQVKTRGLGGC